MLGLNDVIVIKDEFILWNIKLFRMCWFKNPQFNLPLKKERNLIKDEKFNLDKYLPCYYTLIIKMQSRCGHQTKHQSYAALQKKNERKEKKKKESSLFFSFFSLSSSDA